jgi:hypothetical protein
VKRTLCVVMLCSLFGCRQRSAEPTPPAVAPPAPAKAAVEPSDTEIALFAQSFMKDWILDPRHGIYARMHPEYRRAYSEAQFGETLDDLNRTFGKVQEAKYKGVEMGTNVSFSGVKKFWTLWYAVRTDTHPMGTHFAKLTITAQPWLSVLAFTIITFPRGVPPNLR